MQTEEKDLAFMFCIDEKFIQPCSLTILSLLRTLESDYFASIYIVSFDNVENITKEIGKHLTFLRKQNFKLQGIQASKQEVEDYLGLHRNKEACFLRFVGFDHLSNSLSKVIYLDSDILIRDSLHELWQQIKTAPLVACRDLYEKQFLSRKGFEQIKENPASLPLNHYFNAGMLGIDLQHWKIKNIRKTVQNLSNNNNFSYADQDILNLIYHDKVYLADQQWNWQAVKVMSSVRARAVYRAKSQLELRPKLIHFITWPKPWHKNGSCLMYSDEYRLLWRELGFDFFTEKSPTIRSRFKLPTFVLNLRRLCVRGFIEFKNLWSEWRQTKKLTLLFTAMPFGLFFPFGYRLQRDSWLLPEAEGSQ